MLREWEMSKRCKCLEGFEPCCDRFTIGRELINAFGAAGLELTGKNPTYRCGSFKITIDFEAAKARMEFGGNRVRGGLALNPDEILALYQRSVAAMEKDFGGPDAALDVLRQAYLRTLKSEGKPDGSRVNIISVLREYVGAKRGKWAGSGGPFRAQFAYDIHRLSVLNRLTIGGRRLNLGVATMAHADKQSDSIGIPGADGTVNIYMHLAFIEYEP